MARVLLVTNIFPPHIGGPAAFIDRLATALSDVHSVTVVCSSDGLHAGIDDDRPFMVRRVDSTNRYRFEVEVRARLAAELVRHDRVLVNGLETYVAPIARRLRRHFVLKVVGDPVWEWGRNVGMISATFDDFQNGSPPDDARLRALTKSRNAYLNQAQLVVTPSEYLRGIVAGWGVPSSRVIVIPNGAPSMISARTPSSVGPLRLLFCGRLTNWKGVETALLAMRGLDGVELTVAGDGPELPMLSRLRTQLDIAGKVTFTGRLGRAAVDDLMSAADALILLSSYEGLSHTVLEACAHGLVPIVSSIGGNLEVITDGVNGLTVPEGNVSALERAIIRLRDPETRRVLAAGAVATAARFPFDETVRRFVTLLES